MTGLSKPELGSLEHYGVKGMKWGVHNGEVGANATRGERRAAKKESKLAYKAWKKEVGSEKVANEIFQEATKSFNKDVRILNNDPAFKGKDLTTNPGLRRQYDAAVSAQFNARMADASVARTMTNTGRAMIYQFDSSVGMMRAQESQLVYHADDDDSPWPEFVAEMDSLGHVISLRPAKIDESLKQAEDVAEYFLEHFGLELTEEQLAHYGVVGMKWGQRKKGNAYDIRQARASVEKTNRAYRDAKENAKRTHRGNRAAAKIKAQELKIAALKNPDRVLAARLTRGEKAIALLFTPIGMSAIAVTSAYSRRIEQKQETGAYDKK